MQSAAGQNGASAAQIESNGKASHAAVVQATVAESNGSSGRNNGTAALQNGAAASYQDGITTVEGLKDAATVVSTTENGAIGADSEQNGAWADPCEVGHLEACASDRCGFDAAPSNPDHYASSRLGVAMPTDCTHADGQCRKAGYEYAVKSEAFPCP